MFSVNYSYVCIGGLFLGGALLTLLWNIAFLMRSESTEGEIVGSEGSENDEGSISQHIVQFKTKDGQTIEFTDSALVEGSFEAIVDLLNTFIFKRETSNKVMVVYDPNNPKRARIKNFQYLYFWPLLLFFIATVACIASVLPFDKIQAFFTNLPFQL